jgi:hypothetical protein
MNQFWTYRMALPLHTCHFQLHLINDSAQTFRFPSLFIPIQQFSFQRMRQVRQWQLTASGSLPTSAGDDGIFIGLS